MNPHLLFAFWGLAFVLIVVPGPDWAFVLGAAARDGVFAPAVAGLAIGYSLLTAIVAAGFGTIVAHSATLLTTLTGIGAGYLAYLGTALLRRPATPNVEHNSAAVPESGGSRVLAGIGVSGLNPKGLLVYLALVPQFTDKRGAWPMQVQLAALGLLFVVTCAAFYLVIGVGARTVLSHRATAGVLARVCGIAMITVGLTLVMERIYQLVR